MVDAEQERIERRPLEAKRNLLNNRIIHAQSLRATPHSPVSDPANDL
jgi:hypothetical protein